MTAGRPPAEQPALPGLFPEGQPAATPPDAVAADMPDTVTDREAGAALARLARSRFRARFHLGAKERAILGTRGPETVRRHAAEIIAARLAPAHPQNDGRQTPMRGHPVFIAQHATATCCRGCLAKWHGIAAGRALRPEEQARIVALIMRWIDGERG